MAAVPSIGRASLVEAQPVAPEAVAAHDLYERHATKIHNYCRHQLGSREEAEDAVQTTFMNAFRALGKGVVPEAEAAWLYKIAENVCLSRRRSSWRRNRIESPADFELIEEVVPGPNRQRDELIGIEDALAAMPEQQRRAILLREWQGLSYREISTELEVSQSAVETLIFRARRSLAQGLTEPARLKPQPKTGRKRLRRTLHVGDLASLLAGAKSLFAGATALKATAAAVVVTAAAGTAVTVGPSLVEPAPKSPLAVSALPLLPEEAAAPAVAHARVADAPAADERALFVPPGKAKGTPAAKAKKAKANGKAALAPGQQRGRPTLPPAAAAAPDRGRSAEAQARKPERKLDRAQQAQQQAQQRADRQAARAERQAQRKPLRPLGTPTAAKAEKPAKAQPKVGAAADVPVVGSVKGTPGRGQERAMPAPEAAGGDAEQAAGGQSKRP